jgi:hypothetical protein
MLELCLLVLFASLVVCDLRGAKEQPATTGQHMRILLEYTYIFYDNLKDFVLEPCLLVVLTSSVICDLGGLGA